MVRVRRGWLHPKYRGVYAVGHAKLTLKGELMAAVKACGPDAVVSHAAAAVLHSFVEWETVAPEVTVLGSWTREHPGLRIHRSERLDRTFRDGIPVTTPVRTLIDLAATVDPKTLRRATNRALALKRVTVPLLVRATRAHAGRRGVATLRAQLATAAPTRSELEDVVLALIHDGGLQPPEVNRPLHLEGRTIVPDFRWPAHRLVVEADGRTWHDTPLARHDDAEREAILRRHGDRVVRVTWRQVVDRPAATIARLTAAGAPRKYPAPR